MPLPECRRNCNADEALVNRARGNIHDWLTFADRDAVPYNPLVNTYITTNRMWDVDNGSSGSPDWVQEGWSIRSELIPLDMLDAAATTRWADDSFIDVGWASENAFDFGESAAIHSIDLLPWSLTWRHPISGALQVELRPDFLRYHASVYASCSCLRPLAPLLELARVPILILNLRLRRGFRQDRSEGIKPGKDSRMTTKEVIRD